ncbi:nucleoside phosphorylase domain-containing protein [Aspergillus californicus]
MIDWTDMPARWHNEYTVGWICALPLEMAAARAMLDEVHTRLQQPQDDHNTYVLGKISGHNVVVACLPSGIYGTISAAVVAKQMLFTFRSIRFGLMVGIGGGVPSPSTDIRLGDIVVSRPTGISPGVVQYDYGKTLASGRLERIGTRNLPPQALLTALSKVESNHMVGNYKFWDYLSDTRPQSIGDSSIFRSPGEDRDVLFNAAYDHEADSLDCSSCDHSKRVVRKRRSIPEPRVHYGTIASGNQVMKDGQTRDSLAQELGVLCFEMEAAGLMDHFPCLVIRGISDYADSHKNKDWQGHAAITAAAYAKELLSEIPLRQEQDCGSARSRIGLDELFFVKFNTIDIPRIPYTMGREQELAHIQQKLQVNLSDGTVVLQGRAGSGKTQLAVAYVMRHWNQYSAVFWLNATTLSTLKLSFMVMAKRILLDHPSWGKLSEMIENEDSEEAVKETKRWLSEVMNYRWLLIYDNYNAVKSYGSIEGGQNLGIERFFPDVRQGHIIITTRSTGQNLGHTIRVEPFMDINQRLSISFQTPRRQDSDNTLCSGLCSDLRSEDDSLNFSVFIILATLTFVGVFVGILVTSA